tara:strand:- start:1553 stop:2047 length:495 start_codon:yes stop_codon:yes gene_type:complete
MNCDSNGRVDILGNNVMDCFQLYDKIPVSDGDTYYRTAMTGNWDNSMLSNAFFSEENMNIIQNGLRAGVYKESKGRFLIGKQDEAPLKMIMRSIFLQNSKNLPNNITGQITQLNHLVLEYAVPQVMGEAVGYVKFKSDASTMYTPIQRPASTYYSKTLELKPWF